MRFLIDTHVLLWAHAEPERLRTSAQALLRSPDTSLVVSTVSVWEIAIKYSAGKLELTRPPSEFIPTLIRELDADVLAILDVHAYEVARLARHHGDPFDRMLVAQSRVENLPLMTADAAFAPYGLQLVPA